MKFSSTVHPLFNLFLIGFPIFFFAMGLWMIAEMYPINSTNKLWALLIYFGLVLLPSLFLLAIRFYTYCYLHDDHILIKTSFRKETVPIKEVTQISYPVHIRPAGMKAVLDFNGILIIHGEGYQTQITPQRPDEFVNILMAKNQEIKLFKK